MTNDAHPISSKKLNSFFDLNVIFPIEHHCTRIERERGDKEREMKAQNEKSSGQIFFYVISN